MQDINIIKNQDDEKAINLHWTWFLFLGANVLIIIGIAISWGIYGHGFNNSTAYIPIIICNVISIILIALFYFFDSRDIYLIRQHIPTKYFKMYFSAGFIFVTNLFFIFLTIALIDKIVAPFSGNNKINIAFGIIFGIACLISLITVGIYRYAKYRIDLALYLRRRGQSINLEHEPSDSDNKPTSSLTANADSK